MNLSAPFIKRPVATTLLTLGLALFGAVCYFLLPVARLPSVDFPVISVSASLSGASPADMAKAVATPLERTLGSISGVNEMTSGSSNGSTRINLQFDLNKNIDDAALEVQAAINAAKPDLPATLRSMPTYRKMNPAAAPFMTLALTSDTKTAGQMYEAASNILLQKILQVQGVGDVTLGGGSLPAVRVELNPFLLNELSITGDEVRSALQTNNATRPKGVIETGDINTGRSYQIITPPAGLKAIDYENIVIKSKNDSLIRLKDIAKVTDGVQNAHRRGLFNGKTAVIMNITQQPDANLIQVADAIDKLIPQLSAQLPQDIQLNKAVDRTSSVRASVKEVEITLLIAIMLVIIVVGLFLQNIRAAIIPAVATIVSLLGTFCVMYFLGYSLNNLTLMALTVATGFVVDDAIVVMENTSRHIEEGMSKIDAALRGAKEVGFTVLTISLSLVAVFLPLLLQSGAVGAMFREFAGALTAAVLISLILSLTTTPMMCAWFLPKTKIVKENQKQSLFKKIEEFAIKKYIKILKISLNTPLVVLMILTSVIILNAYMFTNIKKGYFPEQDSGQIRGGMRADQSISSKAMAEKLAAAVEIIKQDPAVETVVGFSGGMAGGGFLGATLKSAKQTGVNTRQVINRLRPKLSQITGLSIFLSPSQELRMGGRSSNSNYQYTLKAENQADLKEWVGKLSKAMKQDNRLADIDDEESDNGVKSYIKINHDKAAALGINNNAINSALYNAFGQRQVATMYSDINQYAIVMEWASEFAQSPQDLKDVYIAASSDEGVKMVALETIAEFTKSTTPTSVWHDNGELSSTISFNLGDGAGLEDAKNAILEAENKIAMPNKIRGQFSGAAAAAQNQNSENLYLIIAAIVVIYIVLGILYESLIHPITVLSTLPAAGLGAIMALLIMKMEFSIMALIGVFLLIGIVKKNAILIIDFALAEQRENKTNAKDAVITACQKRFRPIMMTTLAAALGAIPLAIGFGQGAELRQPLGVTIIGGLIVSQILTLLTTPVIYLTFDKLQNKIKLILAKL